MESTESTESAVRFDESSHLEDEVWVGRAQCGDAGAFDALVLKHSGKLYGLVYHMTSNHEDTNDLLQDIWSRVFRALAGFRKASRFSTWLHSIAVNMTINFLKRRGRRAMVSLDAEEGDRGGGDSGGRDWADTLLVTEDTPRAAASRGELQKRLSEALGRLSPEHRAVVTMFDIQGMPHSDIARILSVSEGTVRSRLFYAHRQLQVFLSEFRNGAR